MTFLKKIITILFELYDNFSFSLASDFSLLNCKKQTSILSPSWSALGTIDQQLPILHSQLYNLRKVPRYRQNLWSEVRDCSLRGSENLSLIILKCENTFLKKETAFSKSKPRFFVMWGGFFKMWDPLFLKCETGILIKWPKCLWSHIFEFVSERAKSKLVTKLKKAVSHFKKSGLTFQKSGLTFQNSILTFQKNGLMFDRHFKFFTC